MALLVHSFGPFCRLHEDSNEFTRRASGVSDEAPKLRAHFFYNSALPIDDPLSPVPTPSTTHTGRLQPPRPFSVYDNAALEEAWQGLQNHNFLKDRGKLHGYGLLCTDKEGKLNRQQPSGQNQEEASIQAASAQGKVPRHGLLFHKIERNGTRGKSQRQKVHGHGPYCHDDKVEGQTEDTPNIKVVGNATSTKIEKTDETRQDELNAPTSTGSGDYHVLGAANSLPVDRDVKESGSSDVDRADKNATRFMVKPKSSATSFRVSGSPSEKDSEMPENPTNLPAENRASPIEKGRSSQEDTRSHLVDCDNLDHANDTTPPTTRVIIAGSTRSYGDSENPVLLCDDPQHAPYENNSPHVTAAEIKETSGLEPEPEKKHRNIFRRMSHRKTSTEQLSKKPSRSPSRHQQNPDSLTYGADPADPKTTKIPFIRAPSPVLGGSSPKTDRLDVTSEDDTPRVKTVKPITRRFRSDNSDSQGSDVDSRLKVLKDQLGTGFGNKEKKAYVPVGFSRLHLVEMPALEMKPIYWSPVHDISSVVRGTWFYKATMLPVESDVANQLEEGYEYMKPWTSTYNDEVNSCLEIGPEAELKIVYKLWPEDPVEMSIPSGTGLGKMSRKSKPEPLTPEERARKVAADAAISIENKAVGTLGDPEDQNKPTPIRLYARSSVMYANGRDAQILKPSMLPSTARGRKPLAPIRKGRVIGIPVVRGFDQKAWDKLYPPKKTSATKKVNAINISQSGAAATITERDACPACVSAEERPKVTELVLVIHGIGQKLSERIESYHFTHAINSFRRQMNVELEAEAVQPWLRPGLGGMMVLPVNWRSALRFEDGGDGPAPSAEPDKTGPKEVTLKDITADTIPAVRNLISDVMLDIPYYLSHHKPKMIEAVIKEANRIYRLWCSNNPDFHTEGRVHLIAHSLGSVMALDILSKQPTRVPKHLDLTGKRVNTHMFEFDTSNLFFCGSPAGFFLLLNHASLLPRRARGKPGADGEDLSQGVTGDAGTYGCLAVDNIYNVMHYNDPIAYRVNATVDVDYANHLQPAAVPSAASTWLQSIGSVFRGKATGPVSNNTNFDPLPPRPTLGKLPSTIEMETHNFTLEEIAEKKMYLLNDNGQIDYSLSSGGGPLEIQYINMLSAHSSYWTLQDFVRFLVVEIGRRPGRPNTVPGMRAVKKIRSTKS